MSINLLDLNADEKKVYLILSVSGQLSLPEIVVGTGLDYETVKGVLQGLINKGLIRTVPGLIERYAVVLPLKPVAKTLQEKVARVEVFPKTIEEIISTNLSKLKNDIEVLIQQLEETKEESYTRGNNTLKAKKVEVKEKINDDLADLSIKLNNEMDSEKNNIVLKIRALQASLKDTISSLMTELDEINTGHQNELNAFLEEVKAKASEKITSLPTEPSALNILPEFKEQYLANEEKTFQSNKNFISLSSQKITEDYHDLLTLLNSLYEELSNYLDSLITNVENWKSNTLNFLNDFNIQLKEGISKYETSFKTSTNELRKTIISISTNREENINQLRTVTENFYSNQKQNLENTNNDLLSTVNIIATTFTNKTNTLKSSWQSILSKEESETKQFRESLQNEFNQLLQQIINEFTTKTNELYTKFSQNFNESYEKSLNDRKDALDKAVNELLSSITQTKNDLTTNINQLTTGISSKLDNLKAKFDELISSILSNNLELKEKEATAIEEFHNTFNSLKNEFLETLNRLDITINAALSKQAEELITAINTSKTNTGNELNNKINLLNNSLEALKAETEKQIKELEEIHSSAVEIINSNIERFRINLLQAHSETIKSLTELMNSYVSSLEQSLNAMITNYDGFTEQKKSGLKEKESTIIEELDMETSLIEAIFSEMKTNLDEFNAKSITRIDEILEEGITRLSNVLRSALDEFLTMTKDTVRKNYEDIESKLLVTLREATEITEEIKSVTLNVANGLSALSSEQASVTPPKIMSAVIVGEEAIKEYMKQMVERVKRGITFLAPDKSFIPVNAILSLPMTAQVTIVTKLDKISDREWIETLFKAKANVIIRQLSERTGTGTLPNFIGCEREGEEILLGTIDEDSKETVAIVSMSSYFTKILGNIVIAEYARGRSIQLQRSEFGL